MCKTTSTRMCDRRSPRNAPRPGAAATEVMVSDAPPPATPYLSHGVVDSVFGELWDRPGLSRRDRRLVTLACVAAAAVEEPIHQHVYAALASGDISREEFQELVLHFAYYAGWPRASALEMAYYRAVARIDADVAQGGPPET
jgi:4-carboxymuconolactone decarboxylase